MKRVLNILAIFWLSTQVGIHAQTEAKTQTTIKHSNTEYISIKLDPVSPGRIFEGIRTDDSIYNPDGSFAEHSFNRIK